MTRHVAVLCLLAALGCGDDDDAEPKARRDAGARDAAADAGARCRVRADPGEPVRELDLLLVIDTSLDMEEEQLALGNRLQPLLERLAPAGSERTLHLAVASSDLGAEISDIDLSHCEVPGDDGLLLHAPESELATSSGCRAQYPKFLTHDAAKDDPAVTARDLKCMALLGSGGCGYEQPLESALRALWPEGAGLPNPTGGEVAGQGDTANAGFLAAEGDSLLAVILLTSEDDCSHPDSHFLASGSWLDASDPEDARLLMQGLHARCLLNPDALFPIDRYLRGLRMLRDNRPERVFFAAIAGAPPEAVSPEALANIDFDDPADREQFYADLVAHPGMQAIVETNGTAAVADDTLRPSCSRDGVLAAAYPPHRIVQLAVDFGSHALVQSSCEDDYGPAIDAIAERIEQHLSAPLSTICE